MLVLSRKNNQTICIGNDIKIHILSSNGYVTRVGIDAPKEVGVHREELYQKIQDALSKDSSK